MEIHRDLRLGLSQHLCAIWEREWIAMQQCADIIRYPQQLN